MADCATAVAALRQAEDAVRAADAELKAASKAAIATSGRLKKAQPAYDTAIAAAATALKNWTDYVNGMIADPTFGVPGIEAGCVLSAADVPSGAGSGSVRDPNGIAHIFWGRSDSSSTRDAWSTALLKKMGACSTLAADSKSAASLVSTAKAELDAATSADQAAQTRLTAAQTAYDSAKTALQSAYQDARSACGKDPVSAPTNGADFGVDPLVDPKRRDKVAATIKLLKPEEIKGMKIISHYDHPYPDIAFGLWDPADNTVHLFDSETRAAIVKHEVGHWVYHNRVSSDDFRAWQDFWKAHASDMPTGIAKEDADQGFAECFEKLRDKEPLDASIKDAISKILDKIK